MLKAITVLTSLSQGIPIRIKIGGINEDLIMDHNYKLCVIRQDEQENDVYLDTLLDFQEFIKLCEKITEKEMTIIKANIAMNKIR